MEKVFDHRWIYKAFPKVKNLFCGLAIGTTADKEGDFELEIPDSVKSQKIILLVSFSGLKIKEVSIYDTQLPGKLGKILLSEDEYTIRGEYIVILPKKELLAENHRRLQKWP